MGSAFSQTHQSNNLPAEAVRKGWRESWDCYLRTFLCMETQREGNKSPLIPNLEAAWVYLDIELLCEYRNLCEFSSRSGGEMI